MSASDVGLGLLSSLNSNETGMTDKVTWMTYRATPAKHEVPEPVCNALHISLNSHVALQRRFYYYPV